METGNRVVAGQLLVEADLDFIKANKLPTEVILCITEPKEVDVTFTLEKTVHANEDILAIIK